MPCTSQIVVLCLPVVVRRFDRRKRYAKGQASNMQGAYSAFRYNLSASALHNDFSHHVSHNWAAYLPLGPKFESETRSNIPRPSQTSVQSSSPSVQRLPPRFCEACKRRHRHEMLCPCMRNDVELTTVAGQLYESQATVVRSPSYDEAEPAIYITTRLRASSVARCPD